MRALVFLMIVSLAAPVFAATPCDNLLAAARANQTEGLKALYVKCHLTVDYLYDPWTALHEAAAYNSLDSARVLLFEVKVKVNATDGNGFTPLFVAQTKGFVLMAALLVTAGALKAS